VREQEDRFDVHGYEPVEFRLLDLQHGPPHVTHAGIVDEEVYSSECIDGGSHRRVHIRALRDIAAHRNRLVADRSGSFACGLLVDVDDGDARTLPSERLGDALAEARCGAGHQRNFVVETHAVFLSLCCSLAAPLSSPRNPVFAGTTMINLA
jgi:hypothetical protein